MPNLAPGDKAHNHSGAAESAATRSVSAGQGRVEVGGDPDAAETGRYRSAAVL